jgi:hypothetical protein
MSMSPGVTYAPRTSTIDASSGGEVASEGPMTVIRSPDTTIV